MGGQVMVTNGEKMVRDNFIIWQEPLDGVHNPADRWNGWACPFLTLESVFKVEKWYAELIENKEVDRVEGWTVVEGEVFYNDGEGNISVVSPTFFEGFTFTDKDGSESYTPFYDVGCNGWTWDVAQK
jgi:hypothetical protein